VIKSIDPATDASCEFMLPPTDADDQMSRSPWRGVLITVAVMFGWLSIVYAMSAAVARNDPNVEVPVTVSRGVIVTPADGWYSATDVWDVGESGISLQKSGVYVAFWVDQYDGTNDTLMSAVVDQLSPSFGSFHALPAREVTVAGDLPALLVNFSGITDWGHEENELVALSYQGTSVVMLAEALTGQLNWVQGDIEKMLDTLEVPR
jgi:hypothetical protein